MKPDAPNFDSLAHLYRWMEYFSFGSMLERCRFHFLSQCTQARHALTLGDGDGRFTARLLSANPTVQVDAVDASGAMLAALRERACSSPDAEARLRTMQADLRRFTPDGKEYDLVVSHFFLDCLTNNDVSSLVERLMPALAENAIWVVSEFSIPEKGLRRATGRMLIRSLYFAFAIMTRLRVRRIPDYAKVFRCHGFHRLEYAMYLGGMLTAELWERRTG